MISLSYTAILLAFAVTFCHGQLNVTNSWTGGFQAALKIFINEAMNDGWALEIEFDKAVTLDAWSGDLVTKTSDRIFVYKNKPWNAQLTSSTTFIFEFVANDGAAVSNLIAIRFNGKTVYSASGSSGSTAPTTASTTGGTSGSTVATTTAGSTGGVVPNAKYDYGAAIRASLLFYEAQRAGKLPANNRITWRGDSMLMDKGSNGEDLTGGYFDAGDFVKFGFPMAAFTTLMAWGAIDYEKAYRQAGQYGYVQDAIRWSTDYFIKAHVKEREFYGQVGDGNDDHASWSRPEDWTKSRPAWKVTAQNPGSDLVGETAAALAAASIVFSKSDAAYSTKLLTHARQLYDFANENRGKYSDAISNAAAFYNSWSGYGDELAWAAAWLLRATGESRYQADAEKHIQQFSLDRRPNEFSWDDKTAGVQILLAKITGKTNYRQQAETFCNYIVRQAPRSPKGLVFLSQWGALRHSSNVAFLCLQAADLNINKNEYVQFAIQQMNYVLGDTGPSYLIGFGNNYPQRPHHRASSCPARPAVCDWNAYNSPLPNPIVLIGALVGGPDQSDKYDDLRSDYIKNEVATDYNAGFQSAVAGVLQYYLN